jgi:hypothetical protein
MDFPVYDTACNNVPDGYNDNINSFRISAQPMGCVAFRYVNFPVTTEKPTA